MSYNYGGPAPFDPYSYNGNAGQGGGGGNGGYNNAPNVLGGYNSGYGNQGNVPFNVPPVAYDAAGEEIRTIFVTGFPSDVKERELNNMLRFLPGYVASQVCMWVCVVDKNFSSASSLLVALVMAQEGVKPEPGSHPPSIELTGGEGLLGYGYITRSYDSVSS